MPYVKQDGSVIEDAWMNSIASLAEANRLNDPTVMTTSRFDTPRNYKKGEYRGVSFRISASYLEMIDRIAKQTGISRSDYLRGAVERALTRER